MLPFAGALLLASPVELRASSKAAAPAVAPGSGPAGAGKALAAFLADCRELAASRVCISTMLALAAYNGSLGCYAFFGPKAARAIFDLPSETADLLFGGITVLTGVLGTLCGGLALDSMGASVRNALLLCTGGVGCGCVLVMAGFGAAKTMPWFGPVFAGGELAMFLMAAPVNAVLMWSVPRPELRPFALSAAEFVQHALGDIPSPPALGWLQSKLNNWRLSMCICTCLLVVSTVLFALALCQSGREARFREVLEVEGGGLVDGEEGEEAEQRHAAGRTAGGAGEAADGSPEAADLEQPLLNAA
ncbi:hypothetical protein CHLNCDRAFT_144659 [Chlorella variabilis]|nr:hypothetical protein CHLNCDRAFT_144659 [Chlorella variabilis]EFN50628.1 hypothetical protein CHLNCDRAFT_144659 [Chlorella variabilis]|eukprot:XP_005842748.1 hypothetical protein CHLNCDRAFT_144659 [Chlorella variabilis]